MSPNRLSAGMDAPLVGWAVIAAALTAVMDHLVGLVDVLAIVVGLLWLIHMVGGVARAIATKQKLSWGKFLHGCGKMLAVFMVAITFGLLELVQADIFDGAYIPAASVVLMGAAGLFVWDIMDQAAGIYPKFGRWISGKLNEWQQKRHPGMDPADAANPREVRDADRD